MTLALSTHALTRRFASGGGIEDLNLEVPAGSLYGFVGPNGAGKTTTIRLLLGLLRPQSGDIVIGGQPASRSARAALGALIETPSVYGHLSGYDNLEVTRRLLGKPRSAIDALLERVGLRHAAGQRAGEYSLGMRQRLGLALTLLAEPSVLILDEPANGLDPQGIADLRLLLRRFVSEDALTVIVSSHLLSEVEQVATHIGVLYRGKLRFQGSMAQLQSRSSPYVTLTCDRPEEAAQWLVAQGISATVERARLRIVSPHPAHEINRLVVAAGFLVNALATERPSLESMFFDLTQMRAGA